MTAPDDERISRRTARHKRREAVVALRRRALAASSLAAVLDDALEVVTTVLGVDFCKIVKRADDRDAVTIDELLRDHHLGSDASVIVRGQKRPFGVIGVHSTKRRVIGIDELAFLQAVADVISAAAYRFDLDARTR